MDYAVFSRHSNDKLTLTKEKVAGGERIQIPFYVYLQRNGIVIQRPGKETSNVKRMEIDVDTIMKYAEPGDQPVIEPANKEDGRVRHTLELVKGGC